MFSLTKAFLPWKNAIQLLNRYSTMKVSTLPHPQVPVRCFGLLSQLVNNDYKARKRVGRGPGSGRGNTSGRGRKGSGQRRGRRIRPGFEGGQTPLMKLFPKVGFSTAHLPKLVALNVDRVQQWIDMGRLDATKKITMKELLDTRCCRGIKDGVKLLARNSKSLHTPIHIEVTKASASAIEAVESSGGTIQTVYHSRLGLRSLLYPEKFRLLPRQALPISQKNISYYTDPARRGYLSGKNILQLYYPHQSLRKRRNANVGRGR
ncbi:ribosomal protein subunit L15 [Schizosaccharomyces japonicus yFS275]|uniref:Ribosomal protein subunit L15 n=1 Tax=Schizosaccharomyces japonicus (strain yFS275 / FY16936) TaxID=402676 RepID=B6K4A6_SCHJY|nr:ribosomal protein subunit L15 [Schizosaccharomyces japonicus yFS275]EEB08313.1 ribosomal protein subunit L15 [Schizosaccharomyces japonicus yFS275]